MSSKKNPYQTFPQFVLRTPLFSMDFFKTLTSERTISEEKLKLVCEDKRIQEAIFLASPDLWKQLIKWLEGKLNQEKAERLKVSLLKYISRMCSRCTPFGLFAGTAVGNFTKETEIILKCNKNNERHTRLDMNYLVALTQDLENNESIRDQLKFYPNSSIYKLGEHIRYIEYGYVKTKRIHHIIGVKNTWYLQKIIEAGKAGLSIKELAQCIVNDDITFQQSYSFVIEMVESQLLISELEPSVSGPEFLDHILIVLKKLENTEMAVSILEEVNTKLLRIDKSIENDISLYTEIGELLEKLKVSFEMKYLFQTDMIVSTKSNNIGYSVVTKAKKVLNLLNKLSMVEMETPLTQFKTAFYERYETKPVKLSVALDNELGLGFVQDNNHGDVSKLVDDLSLPQDPDSVKSYKITITPSQTILQNKLIACIASKNETLLLKDIDFDGLEENWHNLPDTMSSMVELIECDGEEKIALSYLGGSSAANLLGRFCHSDYKIQELVQSIINVENSINDDKIIAEIVHLPESRVGNILFRPHLRKYEIPYLANSTLDQKNQINIQDIEISSKGPNQISLKSKKHNKEVIPRLSNAHNFSSGALPVYQFLASNQNTTIRNGIGFSWGTFADNFEFLPRVEYMDVILSPKLWIVKKTEIFLLMEKINNDISLYEEVTQFLNLRRIPQFAMLKDGDNELLVNFKNLSSIRMWLNTVKKREKFQLKEFLHHNSKSIESDNGYFSNQLVLSFFNEERLKGVN